ncbi:MAG: 6-carboxytetrahydropterin synthase, partial [Algisphaera sp.]
MIQLSRTVRFCLSPDPADADRPRHNTFAAWPPMRGLGRYYEMKVTCRGSADSQTGYFINIKHIDVAVRDHVLPRLRAAVAHEAAAAKAPVAGLLAESLAALQLQLEHSVVTLEWRLCPTLTYTLRCPLNASGGSHDMKQVLIKQQYEFSAAHRLHVSELSDEENHATFGKCNNPAGHGHNYRVEVVAACEIDAQGQTVDPAALDEAVDTHVIEVLD